MIYITGDIHGDHDIHKLNTTWFPEQKELTKDDYLIVCGDFGLIWDDQPSKKEIHWLKWLEDKPFTTLFVDGNHENFNRLCSYPVTEWHGGKVHMISDSIIHLMRGQVFDIDGKKFFTMGGAECHDKEWRTYGVDMWREELPSDEEYAEAERNLDACGWEVDYVISHRCPTSVQDIRFGFGYHVNKLTDFFETLRNKLIWQKWYFGHYHTDEDFWDMRAIFQDVVECGTDG